jgi:multiple sugar transport system substrate-binding protein
LWIIRLLGSPQDVLVELSAYLSESEKLRFASDSVGPSWESYWYGGGLWAFPIDAATQVACYRHDLLHALSADVPVTFESVLILAEKSAPQREICHRSSLPDRCN